MKILVLTEHDDCCGPMAAAFLGDYSPRLEVMSVGRKPGRGCQPLLVVAMRECLIDLEGYQPQDLAGVDVASFDAVFECIDRPCPNTLDDCRLLRDCIKNEAYLFFQGLR